MTTRYGGNQEVLITLKLVADQGNAAIAKQITDQAKQAAQGAYQVFEQSGQKQAQLAGTTATRVMRIHEDIAKKIQRIEADAVGKGFEAQVAAAKKVERLRIDIATRVSRIERDAAARAAREQEAAAQAAERQAFKREQSLATQEMAEEKLEHKAVHGYMRMGESALHVVKGVALLAGVEETSVEKLDEMLPKWKAISDVVGGSIHFYMQIGELLMLQKKLTQSLVLEQRLLNAERAAGAAAKTGAGAASKVAQSAAHALEKGGGKTTVAEGAEKAVGAGAGDAAGGLLSKLRSVVPFLGGLLKFVGTASVVAAAVAASVLAARATFNFLQSEFPSFAAGVTKTIDGIHRGFRWVKEKLGYGHIEGAMTEEEAKEYEKQQDELRERATRAREKAKQHDELRDQLREGTVGNRLRMEKGWATSEATTAQNDLAYAVGKSISDPHDPHWQAEIAGRAATLRKAKLAAEAPDEEELRHAHAAVSAIHIRTGNELRPGQDPAAQYEALGRAQEKVAEIQQRILENRRQETAELHNQLGAARSLVQAEKDKFEDRKAAFGKMDPGRRQAVLAIAHKVKAVKELTDSEADVLDESGFGVNVARKHWAKKVADQDADLLRALGESGIDAAKKEETRVTKALVEAKVKEADASKKLGETIENIFQTKGQLLGLSKGDIDKDIQANKDALGELGKALEARDRALRDEIRRVAQRIMAGAAG